MIVPFYLELAAAYLVVFMAFHHGADAHGRTGSANCLKSNDGEEDAGNAHGVSLE